MGVALGLLAAAFYGAADFLGALASKRASVFSVVIVAQLVGFAGLCAVLPFFPGHFTRAGALYGAAGGICGGIGIALLYYALSIGKMGVVSPITAVLAAAVPVFVGVFARGEHLTVLKSAGIAVAIVAIALISLSPAERGMGFSSRGVPQAVASGLTLSGFYVFLALAGRSAGLYPLLCARLASAALLFAGGIVRRSNLRLQRDVLRVVIYAGILDMAANAFYVYASYAGYLAIAAVLTSFYPGATVFLARFVMGERLAAIQKIGVVLALAGVAFIAA